MDQTPTITIGQRIRHLRQRIRLTQSALAAEFGTSQSAISAIEVGDTQPGLDFLVWMAERADTSIEYLVTGRDPDSPKGETSRDNLREVVAEIIAELAANPAKEAGKVGESMIAYACQEAPLNDLECRLLSALRRLDIERQERIVAFAEDLAGACPAPPDKKKG